MNVQIFKPNELIGAIDKISVSRTAKHLLNYLLQFAQHKLHKESYTGFEFEIAVSHINGLADLHIKDFCYLKKSLEALMQPVVLRDDPKRYSVLVPITRIDVDVEKGLYRFELQPTITELLRNTDYFTKLDLHEFNGLESKHSITLYEWLKRYENADEIPEIALDDLKQRTGTINCKSYTNFRLWQTRVLDVAVCEINEKTPYQASYEAIKTRTGKSRPKVTSIKFSFSKKELEPLTPLDKIHAQYEEVAERFVAKGFCETKADFYKATYICDLGGLELFYKNKMTRYGKGISLRYLLEDVKNGTKPGRRKHQIDLYNDFVSQLPKNAQDYSRYIESSQGFLEQIFTLKSILKDTRELEDDLEKWL